MVRGGQRREGERDDGPEWQRGTGLELAAGYPSSRPLEEEGEGSRSLAGEEAGRTCKNKEKGVNILQGISEFNSCNLEKNAGVRTLFCPA